MLKTKLLQWKLCFVIVVVLLTNHICTGDVILSELWGRANAIGYVIDDVFPKWYYHRYDGDSVAMNSINDGGEDLFDIGNKVHYFEGSDAPGDPLTYGNSYEYRTSSIHVGTTSHPFLTLAWIENQEGIHTNYTIQVDSNLGTDGSGAITQFNGTMENDVNGSVYLEYQVFQVYNADGRDPTYCEVYFAIAYEKWNSTFITSNLRFNMLLNGTDSILNAATLDGAIQNVAFGYALLTVENGQLVSMENIEEFLNQLMLLMIDEETPPAHLVSGECDDTIYLNGTTTTTMFHPLSITGARNCEITIQALFGYKIDAILNVSFPNGYLQIYDRSSRLKIIYRYGNNICVSTTGDVLRLRYYSYYTNPPLLGSREGITATYKQYVSTCGQEVQASSSEQTITLIGSSGSDVNHDDCFWRIRPGFRSIKLVIKQLVLDDVNDYLQICEDFEKVKRIESNITTPITLYGVEFGIRYRGGSKSSLVATYQDYTCDQTYQLKVNEEFAIVTSSMLGIIGDDVDSYRCLWSFKSQPGYYLIVDVKAEEYTLLRSTIYAYDNKTNTRWHPYGNSKGYLSSSGFLRLGFRYSRESTPQLYVTYKQFKPSCGELLNATSLPQTISIDAGNPSDCFWNISGTLINLTINDLQLESDDYLEVYEGPYLISRINETLSASVTLLTRTSLGMIILYHKTSIHGIISAVYTKESCDQTYQPNNSSTRTVQLRIPSILFHQPNYWHLHYHRTTCNIYFEADEDHAVIMDYQSLHRSGYRYNIRVYENFTDIGSYNSYVRYPPYIPTMRWEWVSSRSIIHLQLSLRFYFNQYTSNNFYNNLNLATIANINPKQVKTTCGRSLMASSSSAMLLPPRYPLSSSDQDCVWEITSSRNHYIQLTIEQLDISVQDGFLQVSSELAELNKFQNQSTPIVLVSDVQRYDINPGSVQRMVVYFHSGSSSASKVWRASYKEVVCGKTIISIRTNPTSAQSFSFPQNPHTHPQNSTCDYTFISPGDDWLKIDVTDLHPERCCDYVEFFQDSQLIESVNQKRSTVGFLFTNSRFRVHYVTESSNQRNRYNVLYRRFENTCGSQLQANDVEQVITSPGYPNNYGSNQDCVWTITANPQKQIRFTFSSLDLQLGDYLEVNEGTKTTERYSGVINSPVVFLSTGNNIRVHFYSGNQGGRKGFRATVLEVINPCLENPCQNNGVCVGTIYGYRCICEKYYFGRNCGSVLSPCLSSPCGPNGQCRQINQSHLFECVCYQWYSGDRCYENYDECSQIYGVCDDNAICTDIEAGYDCTCNEGYRGDGKVKCYETTLLSYGEESGDSLLFIGDDAHSPVEKLDFEIPFGSNSYSYIRVTSNGLIYLGRSLYYAGSLNRPTLTGFPKRADVAILAPFWDDFHPSKDNSGRVYYQSYNKLKESSSDVDNATIEEVKRRIVAKFNLDNFDPIFVFKATWSEVVMYPENFPGHRRFPSTFQAILATDGCDTYLIYLYKEDAMLWEPGIRSTDNVLIGYSNGDDMIYVESQGDYRPDKEVQKEDGVKTGQYFYKLSSSNTRVQQARCKCLNWYLADLKSQWTPERMPCPCSSFQASQDPKFTQSIDYASVKNKLSLDSGSSGVTEWALDSGSYDRCYQPRSGFGPRCCYGLPRGWFVTSFWGVVGGGPLIPGPFGSRYERFQIPVITQNDSRSQEEFEEQFWNAFDGDLQPRRQCCVESETEGYCRMYERRRPAAACWGYVSSVPSFLWGDPHITTFTGISYTFNGLGEFYLVNTPEFSLQSRTKRVLKEDGSLSNATGFTAFAAKDFTESSGIVQFDVDYNDTNGTGVIIKVNGVRQTLVYGNEIVVDNVTLRLDDSGHSAIFPSFQKVSVKSNSYILTVVFVGNQAMLENKTGGLLGEWTEDKKNTFKLRNGTVLDYDSLKVTEDLDVLNGTLSERMLYPFGLSWQINESESLFYYSGGNDTFEAHNPPNPVEPPFLEDLVSQQRNTSSFNIIVSNCTVNSQLSTSCLYDTLTTNRYDIGQATLNGSLSSAVGLVLNSNTPPNISVNTSSSSFVDGYFRVKFNETAILYLAAEDKDGDNVTFWLSRQNTVLGAEIGEDTGVLRWKPDSSDLSVANKTLEVVAVDSKYGESLMIIPVKLCACNNGGQCVFDDVINSSANYQIVGCNCTEAWSGDDCTEDRDDCELSACYPGVNCTDFLAPRVGFECGSCPGSTTGDGRNCRTIDMCDSNPCSQICEPIFDGYNCSCYDGYAVDSANSSNCIDINECLDNTTCSSIFHSTCNNTEGSYSCDCLNGFVKNGSRCMDVDECFTDLHNCSQNFTCINTFGGFECECNSTSCFEDGTTQPSPTTDGTTQPSPTTDGTTQPSPTTDGTTQPSPTTDGTTQPSPTTDGTTQPSPTTDGTTQPSPTTDGTTQPSPTTDGTTQPSPTTENNSQSTLDSAANTTQTVPTDDDDGLLLPVWAIVSIALGGAALLIGPGVLIWTYCRNS